MSIQPVLLYHKVQDHVFQSHSVGLHEMSCEFMLAVLCSRIAAFYETVIPTLQAQWHSQKHRITK